jgi:hypothetical protein
MKVIKLKENDLRKYIAKIIKENQIKTIEFVNLSEDDDTDYLQVYCNQPDNSNKSSTNSDELTTISNKSTTISNKSTTNSEYDI